MLNKATLRPVGRHGSRSKTTASMAGPSSTPNSSAVGVASVTKAPHRSPLCPNHRMLPRLAGVKLGMAALGHAASTQRRYREHSGKRDPPKPGGDLLAKAKRRCRAAGRATGDRTEFGLDATQPYRRGLRLSGIDAPPRRVLDHGKHRPKLTGRNKRRKAVTNGRPPFAIAPGSDRSASPSRQPRSECRQWTGMQPQLQLSQQPKLRQIIRLCRFPVARRQLVIQLPLQTRGDERGHMGINQLHLPLIDMSRRLLQCRQQIRQSRHPACAHQWLAHGIHGLSR